MRRCWEICGGLAIFALLVSGLLWQQGFFRPAPSAAFIKPVDEQAVQFLKIMLSTWKAGNQEPAKGTPRP